MDPFRGKGYGQSCRVSTVSLSHRNISLVIACKHMGIVTKGMILPTPLLEIRGERV